MQLRRILVPIKDSGVDRLPPAAAQAAELALHTGASMELLHVLYESSVYEGPLTVLPGHTERTIGLLVAGTDAKLSKLAAQAAKRGRQVRTRVEWAAPASEAIARRAVRGFDLVAIGTGVRGAMQRMILGYTDRELVRICARPLLIVKGRRRYGRRLRVLAAIDPMHPRARADALDARVLEAATSLARACGGEVHVVHAVPDRIPGVQRLLRPQVVRVDPGAAGAFELRAGETVRQLAGEHGIPGARVHIQTGHPIDVIAAAAARLKAQVVVMGVVARGTLDRLRFGSTAEMLLDDLPCDILAIKPRGFRSPVLQPGQSEVARSPRSATRRR